MAKGEVVFSTEGKDAKKVSFKPLPTGDYTLKVDASRAEVKKKPEPGKFPYVNFSFEAMDTAENGGKNRRVFHRLFTSLKPGSDGVPMPERAQQVLGLARALGVEFNAGGIMLPDDKGILTPCINAKALVQWLKENDGAIVRARVKFKKGTDGYEDGNEIAYFEPAEESGGIDTEAVEEGFGEEEVEAEAEEEAIDETTVEAEVEEVIEEEEEAPAPPPKKTAPAKVTHIHKKPAPKPVQKTVKRR